MKATAERFPSLREEAERVALQWNYCEALEGPHFYDLLLHQKYVEKLLAAEDAPLKWDGFRQWGFLDPDTAERFVPKLLDEIRLAPSAYHLFFCIGRIGSVVSHTLKLACWHQKLKLPVKPC